MFCAFIVVKLNVTMSDSGIL